MQIHFWGVRGSLPAPEHHAWTYGGNTPCVEVRAGNQLIILDAGSGIRNLGRQLLTARPDAQLEINLLLSHYHWDHIQGLPFFAPIYRSASTLHVIGPRPQGEATLSLSGVLNDVFRAPYFPVAASQLQAQVSTREIGSLADFTLGGVRIRTCPLNHPQGALAFRIDHEHASLVYATDYEPGIPDLDRALRRLARGVDVFISDAQYYPEELRGLRKGWGHSSWEAAVALAREADAKNLFLFHHDPARADNELDQIVQCARAAFPRTWAAAEYMAIDVTQAVPAVSTRVARFSQRAPVNLPVTIETVQEGARVRDDDARLENISFQGAYFLTQRHYQPREPIDVDVALGGDDPGPASRPGRAAFRLRGYVLRTEPQTTNGGWLGVAVRFPGKRIISTSPPAPSRVEGSRVEGSGVERRTSAGPAARPAPGSDPQEKN